MLSDAELADIRSDMAEVLTDTGTVTRTTRAIDELGGFSNTESTFEIACRIDPVPQSDATIREIANRVTARSLYMLTASYDTDLQADDKITIGGSLYKLEVPWDQHSLNCVTRYIVSYLDEG